MALIWRGIRQYYAGYPAAAHDFFTMNEAEKFFLTPFADALYKTDL
jgi:hypothetical protein